MNKMEQSKVRMKTRTKRRANLVYVRMVSSKLRSGRKVEYRCWKALYTKGHLRNHIKRKSQPKQVWLHFSKNAQYFLVEKKE